MVFRKLLPVATAVLAIFAAALPTLAATATPADSVTNARDATAIFNDPAAAVAAGYDLLTDAANVACIDEPGSGAMGIHYVKGALVQSAKIDPARPQALVYSRTAEGALKLTALEYVVLQEDWDRSHASPPTLFGEAFQLTSGENRYGLPAFYSLHAWVWDENPAGTFSPYNSAATCG